MPYRRPMPEPKGPDLTGKRAIDRCGSDESGTIVKMVSGKVPACLFKLDSGGEPVYRYISNLELKPQKDEG